VAVSESPPRARTLSLFGTRAQIKFQAAQMGLDLVRRILLETPPNA
jgi:hypothetical protein